jgi:putative Mg2+ transporter-C (MgtC) family protein
MYRRKRVVKRLASISGTRPAPARFPTLMTPPLEPAVELGDVALRLLAAVAVGVIIGVDREIRGKPVGIRTLALVSLGSALVCLSTIHLTVLNQEPDAVSRVVQGVIQGVMPGIGFIGAGVVLERKNGGVRGLTTAATVWVTAALGIACGLATWNIVFIGVGLTLVVLIVLMPLDAWLDQRRAKLKGGSTTDQEID